MENLRPHHVVCLTKLYSALLLFSKDKQLYYDSIKNELEKSTNLRKDILDCCKILWGTIYSKEVMNILVKIINDNTFILSTKSSDSICSACYGNTNGKCVDEKRIQNMDTIASEILSLNTYSSITITDIAELEEFHKVCDLCGTKQKCDLIRRAIKCI